MRTIWGRFYISLVCSSLCLCASVACRLLRDFVSFVAFVMDRT
jgi:hypothetical protein